MANFNLNKVILGGRITANPELKQTTSGVMFVSFSIAVNRSYRSKNDDGSAAQPQTDFINCVAWRQQAEFISKYFRKGSSICVLGSIQVRSYTDQQGNKRYATDVVVDEANFVDSKSENPGFQQAGAQGYMPSAYGDVQYSTPAGQPPVNGQNPAAGQSQAANGQAPQFEVLSDDDELPF